MDSTAERVARNQSTFRDANERIGDAATEHDVRERVPFICECSDANCTEIVRLALAQYESVRQNPRWFVVADGHQHATPPQMWQIVSQSDGYVVVEKVGEAGEISEAFDPRGGVERA